MQLAPLLSAARRDKLALTHFSELVVGQLLTLLLQIAPEIHIGRKIRVLIDKTTVLFVGGLLLVGGPFARILNTERADHDQGFLQTAELAGRLQDTRHTWIDRQAHQSFTQRRQLTLVHRRQLFEQFVAVIDKAAIRRVDKRKVLDIAQSHIEHLQDDRSEIGALHFRLGKGRAGLEILLRIQAHTNPGRDATTAPGPLVGTGL